MSDDRELRLDAILSPASTLSLAILSEGPITAQGLADRTDSTRSNSEALLARHLIKGRVALAGNGADPRYELTPTGRALLDGHFACQDAMKAMIKPARPRSPAAGHAPSVSDSWRT
jgi:hypothetical protein